MIPFFRIIVLYQSSGWRKLRGRATYEDISASKLFQKTPASAQWDASWNIQTEWVSLMWLAQQSFNLYLFRLISSTSSPEPLCLYLIVSRTHQSPPRPSPDGWWTSSVTRAWTRQCTRHTPPGLRQGLTSLRPSMYSKFASWQTGLQPAERTRSFICAISKPFCEHFLKWSQYTYASRFSFYFCKLLLCTPVWAKFRLSILPVPIEDELLCYKIWIQTNFVIVWI